MTIRHQGERGHAAQRRHEMMRLAESKTAPAADRALRAFLRALMAQVRASLAGEALTASVADQGTCDLDSPVISKDGTGNLSGITINDERLPDQALRHLDSEYFGANGRSGVDPEREFGHATTTHGEPNRFLTAAASPTNLFEIGQARGWWSDAVASELEPVLAQIWRAGYTDTSTLTSSTDAVAVYLANVRDRLVPDLLPGVPADAFDLMRTALTEELAAGSSIEKIGDRIAAEFSWSDSTRYWETRKADAYAEIDSILDPLGEPGSYAREAAKRVDPKVVALRKVANSATSRIDAVQNVWRTRAELIARTETTGAMNAGALQAMRDEGVTTKVWLATGGPRTRPEHAAADGQTVPIDQPFTVGGYDMQMPGDPSGPVDMTVNCRCSMVQGGLFG